MVHLIYSSVILIFLLYLVATAAANDDVIGADVFLEQPLINGIELSDKTTMRYPNDKVSITCTSKFPITWKAFQGFNGTYNIHYEERSKSRDQHFFVAILKIVNLTYHYVGHYFCVTNKTEARYDYSIQMIFEQEEFNRNFSGLSSFYFYVNDLDNPLVYREYPEMTIVDDEFLIFTCRTTIPNIHVKFGEIQSKKVSYILHQPKVGYIIPFRSTTEIYGKIFECLNSPLNTITFNVTYRRPEIESETGVHGFEDDRLTLNCSVPVLKDEKITITWTLPNEKRIVEADQIVQPMATGSSNVQIAVSTLTIDSLQVTKDEGYYVCEVVDHLQKRVSEKIFIEILSKNKNDSLEIYTLDGKYAYEVEGWKEKVVLEARYKGSLEPKLEWFDLDGTLIENTVSDSVTSSKGRTVLEILWYKSKRSGNYTLRASNSLTTTEKQFQLLVKVRPTTTYVHFNESLEVEVGNVATFKWQIDVYPLPSVTCVFSHCKLQNRKLLCYNPTQIEGKDIQKITESSTRNVYVLKVENVAELARIKCEIFNTEGNLTLTSHLIMSTNKTKIWIKGPGRGDKIVAGDNVTLTCEVDSARYEQLHWYQVIDGQIHNKIVEWQTESDTKTSLVRELVWTGIKTEDSGTYICVAEDSVSVEGYEKSKSKSAPITVLASQIPAINGKSYDEEEMNQTLRTSFPLDCDFDGLPTPAVTWYKDEVLVENGTRHSANGRSLLITNAEMNDEGEFKCVGENRVGSATKLIKLKIIPEAITISYGWILGVVASVITLFVTTYFLARFRQLRRELAAAGIDIFKEGNPDRFNPDIALHDQANFLPYNEKYEFPREDLKLGKQLGAGEFGLVVEGWATGIVTRLVETQVAVKMLKEGASNVEIKSLVGELKILVHLGQHINVVNLLGAVTKNITKREILVIVEYCRFGSMRDVLLKNRFSFVNQIVAHTDNIDSSISSVEQSNLSAHNLNYSSLSFVEVDSANAETSFTLDGSNDNQFITTSHLVCWLFQVARGMNYLSSRNVLHGDLAARNVLLSDGNVVKICDFGLARSLYKCDNYMKTADGPLPVKWLAVESICDRVFSTLSDVWSFGILMWEFFSLGATPYPGYDDIIVLINKLINGYRMEKPINATQKLYDTMLCCWDSDPQLRPSFAVLEQQFEELLKPNIAKHYVNLNVKYVEMNARTFGPEQTDFLAMFDTPQQV